MGSMPTIQEEETSKLETLEIDGDWGIWHPLRNDVEMSMFKH
jgi:hypothetical protein